MLARIGLSLSDWFEQWFPDAFALALVAVVIVFVATLLVGQLAAQTAQWFGAGFWDLVTFTMQMALIIVTGYAVATSPPVYAHHPPAGGDSENGARGAVAFVGAVLDAVVAGVVELQPDLQRAARAGSHAPRARRRLSRGRRGGVSGRRQRLGARAVLVGRADHGGAGVAAAESILEISGVIPLSQTLGSGKAC